MANSDIIQELNDLESVLVNASSENLYSVPDGYFEGLATKILIRVQEQDLLPFLNSLPKQNPYNIPAGYFNNLESRIFSAVQNHSKNINKEPVVQTVKEELESLSPLLSSLKKEPVFTVPEGYFKNLTIKIENNKRETRIVSITHRRWFRYAAAAVVTGFIAVASLIIFNKDHKDAATKTIAKFENDVKKINDVKQIDHLIQYVEPVINVKEVAKVDNNKTSDVKQLLQDVSMGELKDFDEESKDIEDVMMTN